MPYTKISETTKRQALDKLNSGMSATEAARMFDVSVDSLKRWASKQGGQASSRGRKTLLASSPSTASKPFEDVTQDNANIPQEKTMLDFADSPDPVEKKGIVDSALDSLKGMLGIPSGDDQPRPAPVFSAKLNEKQQRFVDATTPTVALGLMSLAVWLWGRIGPEYAVLAPNEDVARRIVEPLLRVYARHASFVQEINPDVADIGASMFALVGYVNVSLNLYQQIKREKEEYEQQGYSNNRYQPRAATAESGIGGQSGGYADIQRTSNVDAQSNGGGVRNAGRVDRNDLTDKERQQFEALSRLSQLDYQHRARKSGRVA